MTENVNWKKKSFRIHCKISQDEASNRRLAPNLKNLPKEIIKKVWPEHSKFHIWSERPMIPKQKKSSFQSKFHNDSKIRFRHFCRYYRSISGMYGFLATDRQIPISMKKDTFSLSISTTTDTFQLLSTKSHFRNKIC